MKGCFSNYRLFVTIGLMLCLGDKTFAQFSISGMVTDSSNNAPLSGATVFLSNATKGTTSSSNGSFILSNVRPGQYELVISMIGYEAVSTVILINSNKENIHIKLLPKAETLRPVVIIPDAVRQRYYQLFKKVFIGTMQNAPFCKILNADILYFEYDKTNDVLSASTDDFLIIENSALGYRIKFLLRKFTVTNSFSGPSISYYEGQALFQDMEGGKAKMRRWDRNRRFAYDGSTMHFFRSAAANRLPYDGYILHRLVKKPNADRPSDDTIRLNINRLRIKVGAPGTSTSDSIDAWQRKFGMPKMIEMLSRDTLPPPSVIKRTDQVGVYALKFPDFLYVSYTKKKQPSNGIFITRRGIDGGPYSVLTPLMEYAFFDSNGVLLEPQSLMYEGYWAVAGAIADMLPSDFELKN